VNALDLIEHILHLLAEFEEIGRCQDGRLGIFTRVRTALIFCRLLLSVRNITEELRQAHIVIQLCLFALLVLVFLSHLVPLGLSRRLLVVVGKLWSGNQAKQVADSKVSVLCLELARPAGTPPRRDLQPKQPADPEAGVGRLELRCPLRPPGAGAIFCTRALLQPQQPAHREVRICGFMIPQ
jgi:hypothetical protein